MCPLHETPSDSELGLPVPPRINATHGSTTPQRPSTPEVIEMPTSFQTHDTLVESAAEQRRTLRGAREGFSQWDRAAARFRADPKRPLSEDLEAIAGYVQLDDVFLDVGGGAGR